MNSEGLTRATRQIIGTLRVGGNLASNLNIIAEDISFDMQIKLKEYSQKLNGFILIYTFFSNFIACRIINNAYGSFNSYGGSYSIKYSVYFVYIVVSNGGNFYGCFNKKFGTKGLTKYGFYSFGC